MVAILSSSEEELAECMEDGRLWLTKDLRDPGRVFAKKQAQKVTKTKPRCIISVSLIDQLVTRYFFQGYTDAEGAAYPNLLTMKGVGFNKKHATCVGMAQDCMNDKFDNGPVASDVKGWEKSVTYQSACASHDIMHDTCDNLDNPNQEKGFKLAFAWWSMSLISNLYVLDNGQLIDFRDKKGQRSGDFLTTTCNGDSRAVCALAIGSLPKVNGDDCIEWTRLTAEQLVEAYKKFNLPVREVKQFPKDRFEFCSHVFARDPTVEGGWLCWLASWERMVYESSFSKDLDESEINWKDEMINNPDPEVIKKFMSYLHERRRVLTSFPEHDEEIESQLPG